MELKDSIARYNQQHIPIYDPYHYSFIFKKTEKIVYAVFYITAPEGTNSGTNGTVSYTQEAAREALDLVLDLLTQGVGQRSSAAVRGLLRLESALQLCVAAGVIEIALADVLTREIEDVLRNIYALEHADARAESIAFDQHKVFAHAVREQKLREHQHKPSRVSAREQGTTPAGLQITKASGAPNVRASTAANRRGAIRDVLSSKGQANIKDISDVITDCSEKTIQRELMAMIKDGEVVREGERRWSVYKLK